MFWIDRRILTHFDFLLIALLIPIVFLSTSLVAEISEALAKKQMVYILIGMVLFMLAFSVQIRKLSWLIPALYWFNIGLLVAVEFVGVSKLGAQRWLELPFVHFTLQPSELIKPAFVLMLAYLIQQNPPGEKGYDLRQFAKLSFFILLPFVLILKQPDLGTALVLLLVGYGVLLIIGVNWRIWAGILAVIAIAAPFLYGNLHDYQKKRIKDFLGDKPHYHVQQSIIAIGSGGLYGKDKEEATQAQLKFLPIATSDFIFAYFAERYGFWGSFLLIILYAVLILHIFSLGLFNKGDYFLQVVSMSIAFLLFIYMSVNIAMTLGLAPVVGLPLPLFSYGGSSFVNFMILFGILENLLAFRFNFMYNSAPFIRGP